MRIPTKTHGVLDYATAGTLLAAPALLRGADARSRLALTVAGGGVLATSLLTDYELGAVRKLPMPVHLALDAVTGVALAAAPWVLGGASRGLTSWLPHLLLGAGELAGAALTERAPADRAAPDEPKLGVATPPPVTPTGADVPLPGDTGGQELRPRLATPPIETPGPSVPAPALPESETERAEWAEEHIPDMEFLAPTSTTDSLLAEEEAAAAAEAALIGGIVPHDAGDPAMDPVYEAGGGEAEGWEAAEADLIENATHGDGHGNPLRDAFAPEAESDLAGAAYAEGDRLPSTEVVSDPDSAEEGDDDPGAGPGIAAERT